jgi:bis(5'-nucleosyl)-tetraphosphatase (symmetrical)
MYGDEPDRWSNDLEGTDRLRFAINVLTRLRVCTADGIVDLKMKGKPVQPARPMEAARPQESGGQFQPWFDIQHRLSRDVRVIFGHWSALGLVLKPGIVGLDTGCVWGGALTAYDLDAERPPISLPCAGYQSIEAE